jgi:hypothetical protein
MKQPTLPPGLSPEQTQTGSLLRQLLGNAIANRYLDFCKLANGGIPLHATRPLAGHAMRELESLLRQDAIIGLSYGPLTPASSHVLARYRSGAGMAFLVSVRQTSVPMGGVLAGLVAPPLVLG